MSSVTAEKSIGFMINPEAYYSVDEAAGLLGCSPRTLEKLRATGGGPVYSKLGRRLFYKGSDLTGHLEESRRRSTVGKGLRIVPKS
jgi:hypothetical protein